MDGWMMDAEEMCKLKGRAPAEMTEVNTQISQSQVSMCERVSRLGPGSEQRLCATPAAAGFLRPAVLLLLDLASSCSGGSETRSSPGLESGSAAVPAALSPDPTGSAAGGSAFPAQGSGPWRTKRGVSCSFCSAQALNRGTGHRA